MQTKKTKPPADRAYVFAMQLKLLQRSVAAWPRRSTPLLVANCGDGRFLKRLWQSGFDVIGAEADPALRLKAEQRDIPGLEVIAADSTHIPCEDDSFDWVILHLTPKEAGNTAEAAQEALRVARRGILAVFWNRASIAGIWRGHLPWGDAEFQPVHTWWSVWSAMQGLRAGRISSMSTLYGPMFTWRKHCFLSFMNGPVSAAPLGAWCSIRLDMAPLRTGTPLALRLGKPERQPAPAMEYSKKFTESPTSKP